MKKSSVRILVQHQPVRVRDGSDQCICGYRATDTDIHTEEVTNEPEIEIETPPEV
jgi:hypothetical protein